MGGDSFRPLIGNRKINPSTEFKREAVSLANQPGVTKAQIGRELDINPNMITRWQRKMTANGSKAFLGQGVARDEEMVALKRENSRLRKELDFFKRSGNVLCERSEAKYQIIERCRDAFPVRMMCRCQNRQLVLQAVLMALWQLCRARSLPSGHNAPCEGFFGMLKRERVNRRRYQTHREARADIFDYIECFYNPRRRRKIEALKRKKPNLTQLSVVAG